MKIRPIFTENMLLKIVSVVLSIILWTSYGRISGEKTITHIDIAPTFSNLPEGFEIVTQEITSVRLRVQGNTRLLKNVSIADFNLNINLQDISQPSEIEVLVLPILQYPSQIEILEVNPVSLELFIDRTISRNIPLYLEKADISNVPYGKKITDIVLVPSHITIEGPQSEVNLLEPVPIKPITLPNIGTEPSVTVNGQPDLPPGRTLRWKSETRRVGVQIIFGDIIISREFRRIPIRIIPDNIKYSLSPQSFVDIQVSGPMILLERISEELRDQSLDSILQFYAYLDLKDYEFNRNERKEFVPRILHTEKFTSLRINPRNFFITFNESYEEYLSRSE